MKAGERHAWQRLAAMVPATVCARTGVSYDAEGGCYAIPSFGDRVRVVPAGQEITADRELMERLLTQLGYFSRLSFLHYLIGGQDVKPSGRLVNPAELRAGDIYYKGSHALPLARIAAKYGNDPGALVAAGRALGGAPVAYGDVAVVLYPLPRMPVTLILWRGDEEFPARADLLFDSTCELHAPADIIWSVAMMTLLIV